MPLIQHISTYFYRLKCLSTAEMPSFSRFLAELTTVNLHLSHFSQEFVPCFLTSLNLSKIYENKGSGSAFQKVAVTDRCCGLPKMSHMLGVWRAGANCPGEMPVVMRRGREGRSAEKAVCLRTAPAFVSAAFWRLFINPRRTFLTAADAGSAAPHPSVSSLSGSGVTLVSSPLRPL